MTTTIVNITNIDNFGNLIWGADFAADGIVLPGGAAGSCIAFATP